MKAQDVFGTAPTATLIVTRRGIMILTNPRIRKTKTSFKGMGNSFGSKKVALMSNKRYLLTWNLGSSDGDLGNLPGNLVTKETHWEVKGSGPNKETA